MKKDEAFYLSMAIQSLLPNVGFSFNEANYDTIVWNDEVKKAPTKAEVNAAIEKVKADEITNAEAKAIARQAILDRLGLTAEEAALILG